MIYLVNKRARWHFSNRARLFWSNCLLGTSDILTEFYFTLQDFHRLTDELTQQKEELQKQISLQAAEMESLTQEIQELRSELDRVSRALDVEREKQNFQSNLQDTNENQR